MGGKSRGWISESPRLPRLRLARMQQQKAERVALAAGTTTGGIKAGGIATGGTAAALGLAPLLLLSRRALPTGRPMRKGTPAGRFSTRALLILPDTSLDQQ